MEHKPLNPVVKSFLVCREIFQDARSQDHILIAPLASLCAHQFPCVVPVNLYAQLTSGHGVYHPALQLLDVEGRAVWGQTMEPPFEEKDPLSIRILTFLGIHLCVPRPGKYDLALLLNGEEAARHLLIARYPVRPGG
jgi:hypothetical protein